MNARILAYGVAATALCSLASPSLATQMFDPTFATCSRINCSSVQVGGTMNAAGAPIGAASARSAGPWVGEIFADNGACLRLDVLVEDTDGIMVAVSPSGRVFSNDDRDGDDLRPLVKIGNTERGWYTVHVSTFAGVPSEADFILAFGRYNRGNRNCASPTPPSLEVRQTAKRGSRGPGVGSGSLD
jgi:hypothetical protein